MTRPINQPVSATEGAADNPAESRWDTVSGPHRYQGLLLRLARPIAVGLLKLTGWKVTTPFVPYRKMVVVGGPHTSNWDFILLLAFALHWRVTCNWVGKDTLFKGWRGPIMRKLGGVSVDRSRSANLVDQVVDEFGRRDRMILVITPEGTRGKVSKWKTGFYHIARGADIPIIAITADYEKREGRVAGVVDPVEDYETVEAKLKSLFSSATPRNPDRIGKHQ